MTNESGTLHKSNSDFSDHFKIDIINNRNDSNDDGSGTTETVKLHWVKGGGGGSLTKSKILPAGYTGKEYCSGFYPPTQFNSVWELKNIRTLEQNNFPHDFLAINNSNNDIDNYNEVVNSSLSITNFSRTLTTLEFSGCSSPGFHLPPDIGRLVHLTTLEIKGCAFVTLLPEISNLENLLYLELRSLNNLQSIPNEIGKLKCLEHLKLFELKSVQSLPSGIGGLTNLRNLELIYLNRLRSLPSEIGKLTSLEYLRLHQAINLQCLPPEIGNLTNLQKLGMFCLSNLQSLPSTIGKLTKLEILEIDSVKRLQSLPPEIGNLTNLHKFKLIFLNNLQSIPSEIGKLQNLEYLRLAELKSLQYLPPQIGDLTKLQQLELSFLRDVQSIPPEIANIPNLQLLKIRLHGNLTSESIYSWFFHNICARVLVLDYSIEWRHYKMELMKQKRPLPLSAWKMVLEQVWKRIGKKDDTKSKTAKTANVIYSLLQGPALMNFLIKQNDYS